MVNGQIQNRHVLSQTVKDCIEGTSRNNRRKCRICKERLPDERRVKTCGNCMSKQRKWQMLKYYKDVKNKRTRLKVKWREKLGLIKADIIEARPEWDVGFNPSATINKCSYCKEKHFDDKEYLHPFMKEVMVYGLTLEDIEELLTKSQKEIRNGKSTRQVLEKRGLDIKGIIREELE